MVRNSPTLITTELLNSINLENSNLSSKSKYRYLMARSEQFEKQISELLQSLSTYTRRNAKLRDSGDTFSESISTISNAEVFNLSLKKALAEMAKSFRNIQDHRDSEVLYFENKLFKNIVEFGNKIRKQRNEIRSKSAKFGDNRDKSVSKGWIKSNDSNNSTNRRRSQSLERNIKMSKDEKLLQNSIQKFELQRNLLLKNLLLKFILSELRFTMKSMNNLTNVYRYISKQMNPNEDLKLFDEFFNFRPLSRTFLNKIENDISKSVATDDEIDNDDDEDILDGSCEENSDHDVDEMDNEDNDLEDNKEKEEKKVEEEDDDDDEENIDNDNGKIIQRDNKQRKKTISSKLSLRRFNSSPEINNTNKNKLDHSKGKSTNEMDLNNSTSKSKSNKADTTLRTKLIRNKFFNASGQKATSKKAAKKEETKKKKITSKNNEISESDEDGDDDNDESEDDDDDDDDDSTDDDSTDDDSTDDDDDEQRNDMKKNAKLSNDEEKKTNHSRKKANEIRLFKK